MIDHQPSEVLLKRVFVAAIFMIAMGLAFSEMRAQASTSTSGGEAKDKRGSSSYTVGQAVYSSHTDARGAVSEGVQQPLTFRVIAGETESDINLIAVYPNPATTSLTLKITSPKITDFSCELLDVRGRLVHTQDVGQELTSLPIENLASGVFMLRVMKQGTIVKSFQIIKKQ